jgi:hypothetical protein
MRTALAAVAACLSLTACGPAFAQFACMVGEPADTLAMWLGKTGQTPLLEMQMSTGGGTSVPMIVAIGRDGAFSILMRSSDGSVCIMAVGDGAQPSTGNGFPKPIVPGRDS